jgi:hypothetical protein
MNSYLNYFLKRKSENKIRDRKFLETISSQGYSVDFNFKLIIYCNHNKYLFS